MWVRTYLSSQTIAIRPKTAEAAKPHPSCGVRPEWTNLRASSSPAPAMIGVAIRNEKFAASGAVDTEQAGGGNRGAGAGDAGNDRESLAEADEEGVDEGEVVYFALFRPKCVSRPQNKAQV